MTTTDRIAHQLEWEKRIASQLPHPVLLPVRIRWDLPWTETEVHLEMGVRVAVSEERFTLPPSEAYQRVYEAAIAAGDPHELARTKAESARDNPWEDRTFEVKSQVLHLRGEPWTKPAKDQPCAVEEAIQTRATTVRAMKDDPFNFGWISEDWRPIFIELCEKRLLHPGEVIELVVLGGNRLGKTYTMIMLAMCNWLYTIRPRGAHRDQQWNGHVMVLHTSEPKSKAEHQMSAYELLPKSLRDQAKRNGLAKVQKSTSADFSFNAGGFTNNRFFLLIGCEEQPDGKIIGGVEDETGRRVTGGGLMEFRNYGQNLDSFEGGEVNLVVADELITPDFVKTLRRALATRASVTREHWFLQRITYLRDLLKAGVPFEKIPRASFAAMMQSVFMLGFTPVRGFSATVRGYLADADHRDWVESPILKAIPGCDDPRWPRFSQPKISKQLVARLPTRMNVIKPALLTVHGDYASGGEKELKKRLYGHVEGDQSALFAWRLQPAHFVEWKDLPRSGTLYEIIDPCVGRTWAIAWIVVDPQGRHWQVQEWPCESIPILGALPGPWAVVSEGERMNGDEGPAYEKRLGWDHLRYLKEIWSLRARIFDQMKATGEAWQGSVHTAVLKWDNDTAPTIETAPTYCLPYESLMDSRFAGTASPSQLDGEPERTVLESFYELPNGILCSPASGKRIDEGLKLMEDAISKTGTDGLPMIRINKECSNTVFAFNNYTLPDFAETTKRKDEVCKDWIDLWRYYLLANPGHVDRAKWVDEDKAGFGYG